MKFHSLVLLILMQSITVFDSPLNRENKVLKKYFGLELPVSSVIELKLKTSQSKTTYLFVKMPVNDAVSFKENVYRSGFSVEDADCVDTKESPCTKIGVVLSPDDSPEDVIDKWWEENSAQSNIIAHKHTIRNGEIRSFASMFFDSKKGYLMLWYKT
jgi:hypothetical protein